MHLSRYLHTIRHLRAKQVIYQLRARLRPRLATSLLRTSDARPLELVPGIPRAESYLGGGTYRFLNRTVTLGDDLPGSVDPDVPLLWRYNLHYFDYLQQDGLRWETGQRLIENWIVRNPVAAGAVGWQPYTLSLRIVNWLKFMSAHRHFPVETVQSLCLQTENLTRQVEYHILGNHLFANGKALWFAGEFLNQEQWQTLGRRIIIEQLEEQFLSDGAQFELSPMYHAIATEDLLDLINLCHSVGDDALRARLEPVVERALVWLRTVVDSAGRIPLLNDSAHGIAPSNAALREYAGRLQVRRAPATTMTNFDHNWRGANVSGYWVLEMDAFRVLFDTAVLGPDYLPGHAHCDMLSLLLEFRGQSILADTGVYEYEATPRRLYSRSTMAHNTVTIDGLEQGDIWKSFRLGRRGAPKDLAVTRSSVSCSHTGFEQWRPGIRHVRTLLFLNDGFEVADTVTGRAKHRYSARFHFAPGIEVAAVSPSTFRAGELLFEITGTSPRLTSTEYFPQFGVIQERRALLLEGEFELEHRFTTRCTYSS